MTFADEKKGSQQILGYTKPQELFRQGILLEKSIIGPYGTSAGKRPQTPACFLRETAGWRGFCSKGGVETVKPRVKPAKTAGRSLRFQSGIKVHLSAILRLRYVERKSVAEVIAWLAEQKCTISSRSYYDFMARVLRLMPLEQAEKLGVDVPLLRAVRVRLKYPVDPRRSTALGSKRVKRFYSRHRQRRLQTVPKAKRVPPPARTVCPERASDPAQLPLAGIAPSPVQPGMEQITGDVNNFKSLSRQDWIIVNGMARGKLRVIDRRVYPNWQGRVFHLSTRVDYTREDLIKQFGLTPAEAESCFLTL